MVDVVRLGAQPAHLELTIRRRSAQAFAVDVSTDTGPLQVQGAVRLEVEDTANPGGVLVFAGTADGSTITWTLTEQDSDLPFGQRWAALVLLAPVGGARTVWARGSAWVR